MWGETDDERNWTSIPAASYLKAIFLQDILREIKPAFC